MQTQCLVQGNENTQCLIRVRFLRMVERSIAKVLSPVRRIHPLPLKTRNKASIVWKFTAMFINRGKKLWKKRSR